MYALGRLSYQVCSLERSGDLLGPSMWGEGVECALQQRALCWGTVGTRKATSSTSLAWRAAATYVKGHVRCEGCGVCMFRAHVHPEW